MFTKPLLVGKKGSYTQAIDLCALDKLPSHHRDLVAQLIIYYTPEMCVGSIDSHSNPEIFSMKHLQFGTCKLLHGTA
jgi:hypothetical protein